MQAIPYSPGLGTKQLLWLANCGMIALAVAPIGFLGGSIAIRAGWYTAGKFVMDIFFFQLFVWNLQRGNGRICRNK